MFLWLFALVLYLASTPASSAAPAVAQSQADEPAPTCASCHAPIPDAQARSGMGRALLLPDTNPTLRAHPALTFTRGQYTYSVQTHRGASTYSVTDGKSTLSIPITWSFGANNQTWMLVYNGKVYESLVSYYTAAKSLAITTGDERRNPTTLEEAMGRELTPIDVKTCFGCHASDPLPPGATATSIPLKSAVATIPNVHTIRPGVDCAHCHLNAARHLIDASNGHFESVPPSLGKLTTENMSQFCGQCHRSWDMVVRSHWRGEMNVRFQPYRLANSRCFNGADARISCVACHNPHEDVVRDASFYDKKCLACHTAAASHAGGVLLASQGGDPPAASALEKLKSCPVAKTNCVTCHMPKVTLPGSGDHLAFTDHQIRVVRPGEPYPN